MLAFSILRRPRRPRHIATRLRASPSNTVCKLPSFQRICRANWWQCTEVARGTTDWTQVRVGSVPVSERGAYKVTVGAYGAPDGVAWFENVSLTLARKPPLDVYLLYPNFRGMLFDDRPQVVRAAVGATARGGRVRLTLVDEASGQPKVTRDFAAAPSLSAELDAGALPGGRYRLRA